MTGACHLSLSRPGFHNASNVGVWRVCKQHGRLPKAPSDLTDLMRYRVGWMLTCCVPLLGSDDFQLMRTPIEHGRTEVYLMSQLRVFSIDDFKPMKVYKRSMINWRGGRKLTSDGSI